MDSSVRVIRKIKFGSEHRPGPKTGRDFELKKQVTELISQIDRIGTGTIHSLEVKHGLPFVMDVESAI
ncbi:hypothetical protein [Anaerohalosphaera lusitana]|nr:hypothetical protein [Anaerohalosphaera lusitana]